MAARVDRAISDARAREGERAAAFGPASKISNARKRDIKREGEKRASERERERERERNEGERGREGARERGREKRERNQGRERQTRERNHLPNHLPLSLSRTHLSESTTGKERGAAEEEGR